MEKDKYEKEKKIHKAERNIMYIILLAEVENIINYMRMDQFPNDEYQYNFGICLMCFRCFMGVLRGGGGSTFIDRHLPELAEHLNKINSSWKTQICFSGDISGYMERARVLEECIKETNPGRRK